MTLNFCSRLSVSVSLLRNLAVCAGSVPEKLRSRRLAMLWAWAVLCRPAYWSVKVDRCVCVYVDCVSAGICVLWLLVYVSMMQEALSCTQTLRKHLPLFAKVFSLSISYEGVMPLVEGVMPLVEGVMSLVVSH